MAMAASISSLQNLCFPSIHHQRCHSPKTVILNPSQCLYSKSFLKLKRQANPISGRSRSCSAIRAAEESSLFEVIQTLWKDGIEAGTSMVPDSVPRPIARTSVSIAALSALFIAIKPFLKPSKLAAIGVAYFMYLAAEGPKQGRSRLKNGETKQKKGTKLGEAVSMEQVIADVLLGKFKVNDLTNLIQQIRDVEAEASNEEEESEDEKQ